MPASYVLGTTTSRTQRVGSVTASAVLADTLVLTRTARELSKVRM